MSINAIGYCRIEVPIETGGTCGRLVGLSSGMSMEGRYRVRGRSWGETNSKSHSLVLTADMVDLAIYMDMFKGELASIREGRHVRKCVRPQSRCFMVR